MNPSRDPLGPPRGRKGGKKLPNHHTSQHPLKIRLREGDLVEVWLDEVEGVIKVAPARRRRLTIRLGRDVSVEEIEEGVEEFLDETTS